MCSEPNSTKATNCLPNKTYPARGKSFLYGIIFTTLDLPFVLDKRITSVIKEITISTHISNRVNNKYVQNLVKFSLEKCYFKIRNLWKITRKSNIFRFALKIPTGDGR
jgi:hypothetical protein